jgi:Trypsin-like peptidase domain
MPLDDRMLQCACRISSIGSLLGSGFLITVKSANIRYARYGYIVTARHVVANALEEIEVETGDPSTVGVLHEPVKVSSFRQPLPGVDLAIAPFPAGQRGHIAIELEQHLSPGGLVHAPILGAHIYYIGVFQPLDRMMARSGTIGAINQHIPNYEDSPVHLVDCRSYNGFSGSPCFVEVVLSTDRPNDAPYLPLNQNLHMQMTSLAYFQVLCGMFVSHFSDDVSAGGVTSRYGVGVMVRSDEIRQALMTPEATAERGEWDKQQGRMSYSLPRRWTPWS